MRAGAPPPQLLVMERPCRWLALRVRTAMLFIAFAVVAPACLHAQDMDVPVAVQVPLFLKVLTFDRNHNPEAELVVGITFQSGYRSSISARDEVARTLRGPADRKIRVVLIDLDHDPLADVLLHHHVTMLYVSPLRAMSASTVASTAAAAHVISVTGVAQYVELGVAVGARLQGDRPRLMVNLTASRLSGADFTSELLKLAEVFQ